MTKTLLESHKIRWDHRKMSQWVGPNSRVLDLGCGDGDLLLYLSTRKQVQGYGVEHDIEKVVQALNRGINVIKRDVERYLPELDDGSFDYVIMSDSIQTMRQPETVLKEVMRIGRQAIVSFPNMGYWRNRLNLFFGGKMPVNRYLPQNWYDTPNIHLCTIKDFVDLCRRNNIQIKAYNTRQENKLTDGLRLVAPNLTNPIAIYLLTNPK